MNCPACAASLVPLEVGRLVVDVCRGGCGGLWFDNFELNHVDEAHEKLGAALAALEFDPAAIVVLEKRPCPKCAGMILRQHKFSREKAVNVDVCPNCAGVWLDGGELAEIRRPAQTQAERAKSAQQFFNKLVATELEQLRTNRARA